jgi:chitodextrinase
MLLGRPGYAQDATVTINYDQNTGRTINPGAFGLNLFHGFNPDVAGTPGQALYKQNMSYMKPGMARYHSGEMMRLSSDPYGQNGWRLSGGTWDATKINNALTGANSYPSVMMNISSWPYEWEDPTTKKLLPEYYDDYANFCADLVRIINVNQKRGFKYWEVTNEKDDVYKADCAELGRIYNQAAAAMRLVDPTIKVGGPSFARPDLTAQMGAFFSVAHPNLDFVSFHTYSAGEKNLPTQTVWDHAVRNGLQTSGVRTEFLKYSSRNIEYHHNEYNLTWDPPSDHRLTYVQTIFDAILTVTALKDGATGTHAWNERDGWWGKMGNDNELRPAAHLFANLNTHLLGGTVNNSTVSNSKSVVVLASTKGSWRQFVVINRSDKDQYYKFNFTALPSSVTAAALFYNDQNIPAGGIARSDVTYANLTGSSGALFPKNTVSILRIDLNNIRYTNDATAPTVPVSLRSTPGDYSIALQWNAATDNVGVTGYNVFMNGVLAGTTTTTSYTANWLEPSTAYSFYVKARDATGNESAASATHNVSTTAYTARPVASSFSATSWTNTYSGNVINDAGQTTTSAGSSALRQNGELRMILTNTPQYDAVYNVAFTNPINLTGNSEFKIDARSNASFYLRVKLFDDAGNSLDAYQNAIGLSGDGETRTYTLNFANVGFGTVNPARIKGLTFMYPDGGTVNATVYFDNLRLGYSADSQAPAAPTNLTSPAKTTTSVSLSWVAATDNVGVTGYDVFRGSTKVNTSPVTTTSYTVTGLTANTAYTFTVKAFDAAGNVSAASNALGVTTNAVPATACTGTGSIRLERFEGIFGSTISSLTSAAKYPNSPDFTSNPTSFEAPSDVMHDYGLRMRGYVCPPTTGSYTFWIAGDNNVELWLSTSNDPAGKTRIAYHNDWTAAREWNKFTTQKSAAVTLQAGTNYYIEALMKEGDGGDNLAVGWAKPGQATTAPAEVIPGSALIPAAPGTTVVNTCGSVTNSSFESDLTGWTHGGSAAVSASANTGSKAVVLGTADGGLNYGTSIAAAAGSQVTFETFAKVEGAPSWAGVGIDYLNASDAEVGEDKVQVTATAYTKVSFTKTAPANTAKIRIWAWKSGTVGKLYLDDVCLRINASARTGSAESLASRVAVFPNPAKSDLTITLHLPEKGAVNVRLYNQLSNVKVSRAYEGKAGANRIVLPLAGVEKGLYFVQVSSGTQTVTKRVLVDR